jgi:hypothetical protein
MQDDHALSLRPSATTTSLSLSARQAAGRAWLYGYGMVSPVNGAIAVASAIFDSRA